MVWASVPKWSSDDRTRWKSGFHDMLLRYVAGPADKPDAQVMRRRTAPTARDPVPFVFAQTMPDSGRPETARDLEV
jgi:hypothetical protein